MNLLCFYKKKHKHKPQMVEHVIFKNLLLKNPIYFYYKCISLIVLYINTYMLRWLVCLVSWDTTRHTLLPCNLAIHHKCDVHVTNLTKRGPCDITLHSRADLGCIHSWTPFESRFHLIFY